VQKYKDYQYCMYTGRITSLKSGKTLVVTEDGFYVVQAAGVRTKIKADKLCWMLGNNQYIPEGYTVLHRNLDVSDCSLKNLLLLPNREHRAVLEASANLTSSMKLSMHPTDAYSVVLSYKLNGKLQKDIFTDSTAAKRKFKQLQLKFAKILSKYCISS